VNQDAKESHSENPFESFGKLFAKAESSGMQDPNAVTLSTVDESGIPWARIVLMKSFDHHGFVFYTNLESRKGRQIADEPRVCLSFFWRRLQAQAIISGTAQKVSDEEADAYFATRPRTSQLGAWASDQSRPLSGRGRLMADVARLEARYFGRAVPRPPHWSGFRVVPNYFEIWSGGAFRLHDRTVYHRQADSTWSQEMLYP